MRIVRFEADGQSRIGLFEDGAVRDVTDAFEDFRDVLSRPRDAADVDGGRFDVDDVIYLPQRPTATPSSVQH